MKSRDIILAVLLLIILGGFPFVIFGQRIRERLREERKGYVWEPELEVSPGAVVPGFLRPAYRPGYQWVEAAEDDAGRWHPGYWKPLHEYVLPEGKMAWVPGHCSQARWLEGYWRIPERKGYKWVDGYYDLHGHYREGHWEKAELK